MSCELNDEEIIEILRNEIIYRDDEIDLLYKLIIKYNKCLVPLIHLYGLSGTGKTYLIRKFMNKITKNNTNRIYIYINSIEFNNLTIDLIFNEIVMQISKKQTKQNMPIVPLVKDESSFINYLNKILDQEEEEGEEYQFYLVIDNFDCLKNISSNSKDTSEFILFISKLNDYLNKSNRLCILLISEIDWYSLLNDFNLMSLTNIQKPFSIYLNQFNKQQLLNILAIKYENKKNNNELIDKNYINIIIEVFYSICKDLNELSYLIDTFNNNLLLNNQLSTNRINLWNKLKPLLKQALTKIYLRESFNLNDENDDEINIKIENLKLSSPIKSSTSINSKLMLNTNSNASLISMQLPLLIKYLLISAYIATHNSSKYDKKLFDYFKNSSSTINKSSTLKLKFNPNHYQKLEEKQHAASIKLQQFNVNRLFSIFYSLISNELNTKSLDINLSMLQCELQTLKNLNLLQQISSNYACLDEPKYKCLLDFNTIQNISNSVNFNIKQYLSEYFLSN